MWTRFSVRSIPALLSLTLFFSLISTAKPVLFKTQLHNLESEAGQSASFRCETTKPGAIVVWKCADRILATSSKYQLKQDGAVVELVIHKLQSADSGEYSCDTGYQRTSAVLTVKGRVSFLQIVLVLHPLKPHLLLCITYCALSVQSPSPLIQNFFLELPF